MHFVGIVVATSFSATFLFVLVRLRMGSSGEKYMRRDKLLRTKWRRWWAAGEKKRKEKKKREIHTHMNLAKMEMMAYETVIVMIAASEIC